MWTRDDLTEVTGAIKQLALGKRLVKISFTGVNGSLQTNEYAPADLPQLRKLRTEIQQEIAVAENEDFSAIAISNKGL